MLFQASLYMLMEVFQEFLEVHQQPGVIESSWCDWNWHDYQPTKFSCFKTSMEGTIHSPLANLSASAWKIISRLEKLCKIVE